MLADRGGASLALMALGVAALVPVVLRWARVAQREHYEPGRNVRIALIWVRARPVNALVWILALLAGLVALVVPLAGVVTIALAVLWPVGLGIRGTTSRLATTARVRRLLIGLAIVLVAVALVLGAPGVLLSLLLAPLVVDLVLAVLRPIEGRLAGKYVVSAQEKLKRVRPKIVAITGSYGKTTTKNYVAHIVQPARLVAKSPASFNNMLGLSRAVNQDLAMGTEVFVAEMGTYGEGEIRELCRLFPPTVAAITTIGEAHLERMGSREAIVRAKSEIAETASIVVLNVDVPELAALASRLATTKRVVTCSSNGHSADADVRVDRVDGTTIVIIAGNVAFEGVLPGGVHADNVAVAVGVAVALDVPVSVICQQLGDLPSVEHRASVAVNERGVHLIDDTYNANPEGAARALSAGRALLDGTGRLWVVTPGMIELGRSQYERNAALGRAVGEVEGSVLFVVGRTNRKALVEGVISAGGETRWFRTRADAVDEVSAATRPGDVVLFENDLPDHYP